MASWPYAAIVRDAFNSIKGDADPDFSGLTLDTQRHLHDIAKDIVEHGCPTTPFEQAVWKIAEARRKANQPFDDRGPTVAESVPAPVVEETALEKKLRPKK